MESSLGSMQAWLSTQQSFEQKKELRVRQLFLEYLFKDQPYLGAASAAGGALSASNLAFHLVPNDHERGVTVSAQSL